MRFCVRLHILLLLLAASAWAQIQLRPEVRKVTADPSGACTASEPIRHNTTSGEIFACNNSTWAKVATPGAGADARWQTVGVGALAARPATCTANVDVYVCNGTGCGSNGEYYYCTATDVWALGSGAVDPGSSGSGVISGCGVTYVSGLTFTVASCTYSIASVVYNSPLSNVTLTASDPTNPRIDVIGVNNASAVFSLAGTPAASPSQPTVDTSTQLQLTFVSVLAAATTPQNFSLELIYNENTEWTCSPTANFNCASTSNPYSSVTDIEATAAVLNNKVELTKPAAGTVDLAKFTHFQFYIRSKAGWPTGGGGGGNAARFLSVSWLNSGGTQRGQQVVVKDGVFGFSSSLTTVYQLVSIPTSLFGANGIALTTVRFLVSGNSGSSSIGFFLDLVSLQAGAVFNTPSPTDQTPYWHTVGAGPSANRPTTCTANVDVYICNGAGCSTNGEYHYCTSANTWTVSGSAVTLATGATNDLPCYTSATAVGPCNTGSFTFNANLLKLAPAAGIRVVHFGSCVPSSGCEGFSAGGQRIQLRGTAGSASTTDDGIGIEATHVWFSSGSAGFKFYAQNVLAATILREAGNVGVMELNAIGLYRWTGSTVMDTLADGDLRLTNAARTSFGRLNFGLATSAFPALKRNGTALNVRLADDSADAPFTASQITSTGGDIRLTNGTANRIYMQNAGFAAPGAASAGQKIQLFGTPGTVAVNDYAIGVESGAIWFSSGSGAAVVYKFYGTSANELFRIEDSTAQVPAAGVYRWNGRSRILSEADGDLTVAHNGSANFGRFNFGGSSSAFPALKRSSATLQARLADDSADTTLRVSKVTTETNCASGASPAVCASASSGAVALPAGGTTLTVNTTAAVAASRILITENTTVGTALSVTCNTTITRTYAVTTITAATSFVITASAAPVTDPACLSYLIVN